MTHPDHNDPDPDFHVDNHGSLALLWADSAAAADWVDENLAHAMRWCGAVVIEPRYLPAILEGLSEEGLTVQ